MTSNLKRFFSDPSGVLEGHRIQFWDFGPHLEAALHRLMDGAVHRIHIVIYEFSDDPAGHRIRASLMKARARGCEVKVVYDAIGSMFASSEFFEPMLQCGIEVREYHSLWTADWRWISKRNHRKIVCIDSQVALIGGFNFSQPYFQSPEEGGYFDLAVEIEGRAQAEAYYYFEQAWRKATEPFRSLPARWQERRRLQRNLRYGNQRAMIVGNDHFTDRWKIRREILFALRHAESGIEIMNPYFLPDPAILKALIEAAHRGVRVRVLVPKFTDVAMVDLASSVVHRRLVSQGIEIRRWPGFLHAKGISIDRIWVSVGSFNLDYRSLFHNLEVVVNIFDAAIARQFETMFDREWNRSDEVTQDDWRNWSMGKRVLAQILYRLRAFF